MKTNLENQLLEQIESKSPELRVVDEILQFTNNNELFNINCFDKNNQDFLYHCVLNSKPEILKKLLNNCNQEKIVEPNRLVKLAVEVGSLAVLEVLSEHGIQIVNFQKKTTLVKIAIKNRRRVMLKALIEKYGCSIQEGKPSPLVYAVAQNDKKATTMLLEYGAGIGQTMPNADILRMDIQPSVAITVGLNAGAHWYLSPEEQSVYDTTIHCLSDLRKILINEKEGSLIRKRLPIIVRACEEALVKDQSNESLLKVYKVLILYMQDGLARLLRLHINQRGEYEADSVNTISRDLVVFLDKLRPKQNYIDQIIILKKRIEVLTFLSKTLFDKIPYVKVSISVATVVILFFIHGIYKLFIQGCSKNIPCVIQSSMEAVIGLYVAFYMLFYTIILGYAHEDRDYMYNRKYITFIAKHISASNNHEIKQVLDKMLHVLDLEEAKSRYDKIRKLIEQNNISSTLDALNKVIKLYKSEIMRLNQPHGPVLTYRRDVFNQLSDVIIRRLNLKYPKAAVRKNRLEIYFLSLIRNPNTDLSHFKQILKLAEFPALLNINCKFRGAHSFMHAAILSNNIPALKLLLQTALLDLSEPMKYIIMAAEAGNIEALVALNKHGFQLKEFCPGGDPIVLYPMIDDHDEILKYLVFKRHLNIVEKGTRELVPLGCAISDDKVKCLRVLLDAGAAIGQPLPRKILSLNIDFTGVVMVGATVMGRNLSDFKQFNGAIRNNDEFLETFRLYMNQGKLESGSQIDNQLGVLANTCEQMMATQECDSVILEFYRRLLLFKSDGLKSLVRLRINYSYKELTANNLFLADNLQLDMLAYLHKSRKQQTVLEQITILNRRIIELQKLQASVSSWGLFNATIKFICIILGLMLFCPLLYGILPDFHYSISLIKYCLIIILCAVFLLLVAGVGLCLNSVINDFQENDRISNFVFDRLLYRFKHIPKTAKDYQKIKSAFLILCKLLRIEGIPEINKSEFESIKDLRFERMVKNDKLEADGLSTVISHLINIYEIETTRINSSTQKPVKYHFHDVLFFSCNDQRHLMPPNTNDGEVDTELLKSAGSLKYS